MKVSKLQERILVQKNDVVVDKIGNHKNEWIDYYSCYASPSTYMTDESGEVIVQDNTTVTFTIRYCDKAKNITSTKYRVLFRDELYDIVAVDPMNYNRQSIKLRCKKVER